MRDIKNKNFVKLIKFFSLCPRSTVPSNIRDLPKKIININKALVKATQLKAKY